LGAVTFLFCIRRTVLVSVTSTLIILPSTASLTRGCQAGLPIRDCLRDKIENAHIFSKAASILKQTIIYTDRSTSRAVPRLRLYGPLQHSVTKDQGHYSTRDCFVVNARSNNKIPSDKVPDRIPPRDTRFSHVHRVWPHMVP
jgi:hypothetical protein